MLTVLSAALLTSSGLSVSPATTEAAIVQSRVLGGYNTIGTDDPGVQEAAAFAARSVDAELGEVNSAERQSAAGSNYRISFTTSDGRPYDAVVRRDLQNRLSVTSIDETTDHGSNVAEPENNEGDDE